MIVNKKKKKGQQKNKNKTNKKDPKKTKKPKKNTKITTHENTPGRRGGFRPHRLGKGQVAGIDGSRRWHSLSIGRWPTFEKADGTIQGGGPQNGGLYIELWCMRPASLGDPLQHYVIHRRQGNMVESWSTCSVVKTMGYEFNLYPFRMDQRLQDYNYEIWETRRMRC